MWEWRMRERKNVGVKDGSESEGLWAWTNFWEGMNLLWVNVAVGIVECGICANDWIKNMGMNRCVNEWM